MLEATLLVLSVRTRAGFGKFGMAASAGHSENMMLKPSTIRFRVDMLFNIFAPSANSVPDMLNDIQEAIADIVVG